MEKPVYMDNAATKKLSDVAFEAMLPYLKNEYGNPSSVYSFGQQAKKAVESSRRKIANSIGALWEEIYFTSGGTESNNWAVRSAVEMKKDKGRHIITSAIEHPAIMNTLKYLERGYEVTYLGVDKFGQISLDELKKAVRKDTILITVMTANNEIGTVLPIAEIGKIAKENDVLFHTDAVQAVGQISINVQSLNVDLLSFSGHKLGGMKGVGVLFIKKGLRLPPLLYGGGQERKMRSGTENVAGIVSLAAALEDMIKRLPLDKVSKMRDRLIREIGKIPKAHLTGDPINRLPGIVSFVFEDIEGESLLLLLDKCGICASSGSACSSGSLEPSHVLSAIGLKNELAKGSLRLSISEDNTDEDIDYVIKKLPEIIARLRDMSLA